MVGTEPGRLVLVATPIGNLGDLSPRALGVFADCDVLYCEDTRRTRALLSYAGLRGVRLVSLHEHNEAERIPEIIDRIAAGETVAVASDAGLPGISDPGGRVVAAVIAEGLDVDAIPGPNAALTALVLSGFRLDRFCFEGFLPRAGMQRRQRLAALADERRTVALHEAPGRLAHTLGDLAASCGVARRVAVARELTKVHQEIWRGALGDALGWASAVEPRGEMVIVLDGAADPPGASDADVADEMLRELAAGAGVRRAAGSVAGRLGVSKHKAYEIGLTLRTMSGGQPPEGRDLARATFAAGCFWGVEELFRSVPGVLDAVAGYTGGSVEAPTYEMVCTGTTGHAEAVMVTYDPSVVSYDHLLEQFWRHHDPTTIDRQGPDIGSQYRSAVFVHDDDQRRAALESLDRHQARFDRKIVTEIVPASRFWRAEDYHQRYVERTGRGACHVANW
jgi:16S rRNA (cytidine1402-2'-O)-methyltransferase